MLRQAQASTDDTPRAMFKHAPIDLQSDSIRLVEVLPFDPDNPEGTIQCRIRHATIAAQYTCLSYVWGDEGSDHIIMMNGQPFLVRQNLWDFLHVASHCMATGSNFGVDPSDLDFAKALRSVWIDALSIDQQHIRERNHQVQQMGMIYSNAQRVAAWFGKDDTTRSYLVRLKEGQPLLRMDRVDFGLDHRTQKDASQFCHHAYWQRAWITQESILARDLYYVAREQAVHCDILWNSISAHRAGFSASTARSYFGKRYEPVYNIRERNKSRTLEQNLILFADKISSDPRDKVYSLLSISRNGGDIEVDYGLSTLDLGKAVCRTIEDLCSCRVEVLGFFFDILGVKGIRNLPLFSFVASPYRISGGECTRCSSLVVPRIVKEGYQIVGEDLYCLECNAVKVIRRSHGHVFRGRRHGSTLPQTWYFSCPRDNVVVSLDETFVLKNVASDGTATFHVSLSWLRSRRMWGREPGFPSRHGKWGLQWEVLP